MKKSAPTANADEYVELLAGWQRELVEHLRKVVCAAVKLDETVKWGHLFGFWRGKRLREIEPALKAGGKYEMATLELREGVSIADAIARRLAREAVALNKSLGDPTAIVRDKSKGKTSRRGSKVLP